MRMIASPNVLAKVSEPGIELLDIEYALSLLDEPPVADRRPEHRTKPPTVWFVACNYEDIPLFIAGIWDNANEAFILRTAREANEQDMSRWENRKW